MSHSIPSNEYRVIKYLVLFKTLIVVSCKAELVVKLKMLTSEGNFCINHLYDFYSSGIKEVYARLMEIKNEMRHANRSEYRSKAEGDHGDWNESNMHSSPNTFQLLWIKIYIFSPIGFRVRLQNFHT